MQCQGTLHLILTEPSSDPLLLDKTPEERGKILEETTLFAKAHIEAATAGQSIVPGPDHLDTDLHFTCFVVAPAPETKEQRLIELDGRRAGPIDLGACTEDKLLEVSSPLDEG